MGQRKNTFEIPAGAGDYDDDKIVCRPENASGMPDQVLELDIYIESLPATGTVEVEVLEIGGNAEDDNDWQSHTSLTATGKQDIIAFSGWPGVRIRGKSGGTAGDSIVHAAWISKGEA